MKLNREVEMGQKDLAQNDYLNDKHPGWMRTVGEWVGGEMGNRFSVTVSDFFDRLEDGDPIREAVEVFREES